jgi:hypothetical protein
MLLAKLLVQGSFKDDIADCHSLYENCSLLLESYAPKLSFCSEACSDAQVMTWRLAASCVTVLLLPNKEFICAGLQLQPIEFDHAENDGRVNRPFTGL